MRITAVNLTNSPIQVIASDNYKVVYPAAGIGADPVSAEFSGAKLIEVQTLIDSGALSVIKDAAPVEPPAAEPAIEGTPQVGEVLMVSAGDWESHQWLANGEEIADATGNSLTLTEGTEGAMISVAVELDGEVFISDEVGPVVAT